MFFFEQLFKNRGVIESLLLISIKPFKQKQQNSLLADFNGGK